MYALHCTVSYIHKNCYRIDLELSMACQSYCFHLICTNHSWPLFQLLPLYRQGQRLS